MARFNRSRRRGGAAIEFVLLLPVLLPLLAGIFEYSLVFAEQSNVVAASREGVRIGVIDGQSSLAVQRVRDVLDNYGMDGSAATVEPLESGTAPARVLTLTVTVPYSARVGGYVPAPTQLTNSATMLLETQP